MHKDLGLRIAVFGLIGISRSIEDINDGYGISLRSGIDVVCTFQSTNTFEVLNVNPSHVKLLHDRPRFREGDPREDDGNRDSHNEQIPLLHPR